MERRGSHAPSVTAKNHAKRYSQLDHQCPIRARQRSPGGVSCMRESNKGRASCFGACFLSSLSSFPLPTPCHLCAGHHIYMVQRVHGEDRRRVACRVPGSLWVALLKAGLLELRAGCSVSSGQGTQGRGLFSAMQPMGDGTSQQAGQRHHEQTSRPPTPTYTRERICLASPAHDAFMRFRPLPRGAPQAPCHKASTYCLCAGEHPSGQRPHPLLRRNHR